MGIGSLPTRPRGSSIAACRPWALPCRSTIKIWTGIVGTSTAGTCEYTSTTTFLALWMHPPLFPLSPSSTPHPGPEALDTCQRREQWFTTPGIILIYAFCAALKTEGLLERTGKGSGKAYTGSPRRYQELEVVAARTKKSMLPVAAVNKTTIYFTYSNNVHACGGTFEMGIDNTPCLVQYLRQFLRLRLDHPPLYLIFRVFSCSHASAESVLVAISNVMLSTQFALAVDFDT